MKAWFESLETREQRLLLGSAVILAVLILYLAVWEPLQQGVAGLRDSTASQQATLAWMRGAAQEVARLRGSSGPARPRPDSGQSLLSLVDRTAKARRLGEALKRIQPDGDRQVRVWLEGAKFDDVIGWLVTLDTNQGVWVNSSVFEAQETTGLVNARLVFEVGA